jgi:hypothetical protein
LRIMSIKFLKQYFDSYETNQPLLLINKVNIDTMKGQAG